MVSAVLTDWRASVFPMNVLSLIVHILEDNLKLGKPASGIAISTSFLSSCFGG